MQGGFGKQEKVSRSKGDFNALSIVSSMFCCVILSHTALLDLTRMLRQIAGERQTCPCTHFNLSGAGRRKQCLICDNHHDFCCCNIVGFVGFSLLSQQ